MEENNRMGKTRDLFKKTRDTKGTFHAKMGKIKDRNVKGLKETKESKERRKERKKRKRIAGLRADYMQPLIT